MHLGRAHPVEHGELGGVPAVMAMLGERAWRLPRRLGRILPEVDIEGERLARAS